MLVAQRIRFLVLSTGVGVEGAWNSMNSSAPLESHQAHRDGHRGLSNKIQGVSNQTPLSHRDVQPVTM